MRILTVVLAVAAAVAVTGCSNLRARSCPAKACLTNPCGVAGPCQQGPCAAPAPGYRQLEK